MTIKAGDLVMVVRPASCCGGRVGLGMVFEVERVETVRSHCNECGQEFDPETLVIGDFISPMDRLKKIDPPADGDSLPTRKDLEVPA